MTKKITIEMIKDIRTYRRYKVTLEGVWTKAELRKLISDLDMEGGTYDVKF